MSITCVLPASSCLPVSSAQLWAIHLITLPLTVTLTFSLSLKGLVVFCLFGTFSHAIPYSWSRMFSFPPPTPTFALQVPLLPSASPQMALSQGHLLCTPPNLPWLWALMMLELQLQSLLSPLCSNNNYSFNATIKKSGCIYQCRNS